MRRTQKGFTLVELLIVIVVIGILSAMMMLSSTEAVTSAKVSNIVSNLRNLKTAALALYTDNMDKFSTTTEKPTIDDVLEYLNGGSEIPDKGQYGIECVGADAPYTWFIKYHNQAVKGKPTADEAKIGEKLKGRAKSLGLLKSTTIKNNKVDTTQENLYAGGLDVYVHVR